MAQHSFLCEKQCGSEPHLPAADVDSWVRMRRLPYQGDAAKVVDVDVGLQRALIRYVPRLDYAELGHKMSAAALNDDGRPTKKNAHKTTIRPAARSAVCLHLSPTFQWLIKE